MTLAQAARKQMRADGGNYRRDHLRLLAQRVEVAELVGAARPVLNGELTRMRSEGLIDYNRCFFCVDDLAGLNEIAIA
jgi:hypothetical protein